MTRAPRILIAGIGNIFLGDDAFGVEVAAELAKRHWPRGVRVVDFGICGLDLAYALLDGYDTVVLVDAMPRGGTPGTVYTIEPDVAEAVRQPHSTGPLMEAHRMDPQRVLQLVATMGGRIERLLVVGCEPTPLDEYADAQPGLSPAVQAAVPMAVAEVERLIRECIGSRCDASQPTVEPTHTIR